MHIIYYSILQFLCDQDGVPVKRFGPPEDPLVSYWCTLTVLQFVRFYTIFFLLLQLLLYLYNMALFDEYSKFPSVIICSCCVHDFQLRHIKHQRTWQNKSFLTEGAPVEQSTAAALKFAGC